jgi:hypothetical protein
MGNPQKTKGDRAERALVTWLNDWFGLDAERVRAGRSVDQGDITWPANPYHIDVKHRADVTGWEKWWDHVEREADQANLIPVLILRRQRTIDPGYWYAIQRAADVSGDENDRGWWIGHCYDAAARWVEETGL